MFNIQGAVLKGLGRLDLSVDSYKKAVAIKPDYADAYNYMGVTFKEQGKLEEAIEACNKALAIKPDYAEVYYNMGLSLQEQGKLEEAIGAYKKAVAIKPDYADASYNVALLLYQTGQYKKAATLFRKNASSGSQTWLLKCLYELDFQSQFYGQLDYLVNQGENNAIIGSYISRSNIRYGIYRENPCCNHPLIYASKII